MLHLCVHADTQLFVRALLSLSLTLKITKALAGHGLGVSRLLARAGTLFISSTMLLYHQEKQQCTALCAKGYADRQDLHSVSRGSSKPTK